jgi:hypothetical protein
MRKWDEDREALARAESEKPRLTSRPYSDEDENLRLSHQWSKFATKPLASERRTVQPRTPWEEDELLNRYLFEALEERERRSKTPAPSGS